MRRSLLVLGLAAAATAVLAAALTTGGSHAARPPVGIHKIKHVIVIMQENRSFDQYFGTYPGADGLPRNADGAFTSCVPNPARGECERPFHDTLDLSAGGPHGQADATADIDGGKMDGFVRRAENAKVKGCRNDPTNPICSQRATNPDVMGYHDGSDIPNYWAYARNFVLQDHMFEPNASWSLPAHLFMVSEWSAKCTDRNPFSCVNALQSPGPPPDQKANKTGTPPIYAWTDLTYLLHRRRVSWRYYVFKGTEPDCEDDEMICESVKQGAHTPGIWNPLPYFSTVQDDGQVSDVVSLSNYFKAARDGKLPAVSWINPTGSVSEHPPALVTAGQTYVTKLINAAMRGPEWKSTAIFLAWDDWGGFYDHVTPSRVDENGYGLRVPGLVISPYAKRGYIDHQTLSFDAYVKFIEDDFLGGRRLDPKTDGRPDPRPDVRERAPILGDLARDFDFKQRPRRPLILDPHPVTDLR
jgi:phospholipase C